MEKPGTFSVIIIIVRLRMEIFEERYRISDLYKYLKIHFFALLKYLARYTLKILRSTHNITSQGASNDH